MASAWVSQDTKQVAKHGADAASWYVGWIDPDGKRRCQSFGPGEKGRKAAEKRRIVLEDQLTSGRYQDVDQRKQWKEFRAEYEARIVSGLAPRSREEVKAALDHFERLCKPKKMSAIKTRTIDDFVALRWKESGLVLGSTISPATVNKDLRHLRAALNKAKRWDYTATVPHFDMIREPGKLVVYVTPEHFAALYKACEHATFPEGQTYAAADWWRALLVFIYQSTGWRISATLALKREDLDLEAGTAISRHEDNKGHREVKVPLHPVTVAHLKKLTGFLPLVFPLMEGKSALYEEFARLRNWRASICRAVASTSTRTAATSTVSTTCAEPSPP